VRVGCGGCLTSLVVLGLLGTIGTSVWGTSRALQNPPIATVRPTAEDAARAQQKLFRLVRGAAQDPVVVSEAEVNAFVSRNVDRRDLPFDQPLIFLHDGDMVEIVGQIPLGRLLAESPLGLVAGLLPERWSARPVWLQVASRAKFEREPRRQLRLDVRRVRVGQQRVPAMALRLLFDPARLRFVRVPLPETVGDVRIQTGRVVIRPTSSRERT
jgi:hypothetical protein